jgi:ribosomal protein S20
MRKCEEQAESGDAAQARQAASEIGRILDRAHAAVGLPAR